MGKSKDDKLEEIKKNKNLKTVKKDDMKNIKGGKNWTNPISKIIPQ